MPFIIKLQGGLGNQLFQYAFGMALSSLHKTQLLFDLTYLNSTQPGLTPRNFELDKLLGASISIATDKQIKRVTVHSVLRKLLYNPTYFKERSLRFDENVFKIKPPAYFEGFWQSEKYFVSIGTKIRQTLMQHQSLNERSAEVKKAINDTTAVSVHVRRGDYINTKATFELHGICSVDYYKKAINLIQDKVKNPHFFFFSDDKEWTRENLLPIATTGTMVDHNTGADNWQDLVLMSCCHHHIIANSSFSWWGAWLNSSDQKTVIAPERWFNTPNAYFSENDIVPATWIKLSND